MAYDLGMHTPRTRDAGGRAYVGREPDDHRFTAYVTDRDELKVVEQGDSWQTVDEALHWARGRADQVVLTYGWSEDARFSAGVEPVPGLPEWPPTEQQRRSIDEAVARSQVESSPGTPDRLGVSKPEIRRG